MIVTEKSHAYIYNYKLKKKVLLLQFIATTSPLSCWLYKCTQQEKGQVTQGSYSLIQNR